MIKAPYSQEGLDPLTKKLVRTVKNTIGDKDDDYLLAVVGTTGTGKSSLALHIYEEFDRDGCSVDYVGLDQKDFATAIQRAKDKSDMRFCCYDEANVNRSAHMTSWNKDLEDLYLAIRGLQIFHVWNNPTAQKFPRTFIEERMKGLIYIFTKDVDRPRLFYFFTKAGMLGLYDECKGVLSHRNIKRYAERYASYRGWFKDYKGVLLTPYKNKKLARMDVKVDSFFEKYAQDDLMTTAQLAKEFGVNGTTITNWREKLAGMLVPDEDFTITGAGHYRYTRSGADKLKEFGPAAKQRLVNSDVSALYIDARSGGNRHHNNEEAEE